MNIVQFTVVFLIRLYQTLLSPVLGAVLGPSARCRFTPSCSQYALETVRLHGAVMGGWLALSRLARCHPWGLCGNDPPPTGPLEWKRLFLAGSARCADPDAGARQYLFNVAQTFKSAMSRVSRPAGSKAAEPTWKSAMQQVWKPALPQRGRTALNKDARRRCQGKCHGS
jgi:putative membrane protein insertion efficiency factor